MENERRFREESYQETANRTQTNGEETTQIRISYESTQNWCEIGSCSPEEENICAFSYSGVIIFNQVKYHVRHQPIARHLLE